MSGRIYAQLFILRQDRIQIILIPRAERVIRNRIANTVVFVLIVVAGVKNIVDRFVFPIAVLVIVVLQRRGAFCPSTVFLSAIILLIVVDVRVFPFLLFTGIVNNRNISVFPDIFCIFRRLICVDVLLFHSRHRASRRIIPPIGVQFYRVDIGFLDIFT